MPKTSIIRRTCGTLALVALSLVMSTSLCACKDIGDDPPSQEEVEEAVAECVPSERYHLVSMEQTGTSPQEYTYTYQSDERDLTFEAVSTLSEVMLDASIIGYDDDIYVGYKDGIKEYYRQRMRDAFDGYEYRTVDEDGETFETHVYITDDTDIPAASQVIAEMNSVYTEEERYNSIEWMREHPYDKVSVRLTVPEYFDVDDGDTVLDPLYRDVDYPYPFDDATEENLYNRNIAKGLHIASIAIDGTMTDTSDVEEELTDAYSQMVVDGEILDDTPPDGYDSGRHRSVLTPYLDGYEVEYERESLFSSDTGGDATWSDEAGSYVMPVDFGTLVTFNGEETIRLSCIPEFVENPSSIKVEREGDGKRETTTITWEFGGETKSLSATGNGDRIDSVTYSYMGGGRSIRTYEPQGDTVKIAVDDFDEIFQLESYVDEDRIRIDFVSLWGPTTAY